MASSISLADIIEESDNDEIDEDEHSLISFFSDIYSTNTSSNCSNSISEGTLTPTSLHHQEHTTTTSHHSHSQAEQYFPQHNKKGTKENQKLKTYTYATQGQHIKKSEVDEKGNAEQPEELPQKNTIRLYRKHLCHYGEYNHNSKIVTKVKKIDRVDAKFHKLTGDGIKTSSTDGSYPCQFCDKSFPRLGYLKRHEQSHAEHLPFKCDYCNRLFKHKRSRDRHTKLHTGDRRYRCLHCEAAFSRSDHLKIHMKTHDNQKPFQCTTCNRGYNTAAALTSHMQNHKKQAAILASNGNSEAITYSPRLSGSISSGGSFYKKRYDATLGRCDSKPGRLEYPKRPRTVILLTCSYCSKAEFNSIEHLNLHIQRMHGKDLFSTTKIQPLSGFLNLENNVFQLMCEYCTMKFGNLPALFQHIRLVHVDRLTSPNSYFEHFNRLAASGTFSPRLISDRTTLEDNKQVKERCINVEQVEQSSINKNEEKQDEPTDLSRNKRCRNPPASPTEESVQPSMFFCNQCNAGLPDFEKFRAHLKTHLAYRLNLVCHYCGLKMPDKLEHERHVVSHYLISISEYICPNTKCDKAYANPVDLHAHMLDKHTIPVFKCAICSELFESKRVLQMHFACSHSNEVKFLRCSACMEEFRSEDEFSTHVKMSHSDLNESATNSVQCTFCQTVCANELEMYFHLAAHSRKFQCPSCPETFQVEFLRDRHIQNQHIENNRPALSLKGMREEVPTPSNFSNQISSLYMNALLNKVSQVPLPSQNNNTSALDYKSAFAAHPNKSLFPVLQTTMQSTDDGRYSTLQVETGGLKHPGSMYGLSQQYFDTSKTLIDIYTQHRMENPNHEESVCSSDSKLQPTVQHLKSQQDLFESTSTIESTISSSINVNSSRGYSCDICERNDFRSELEVNSHRRIVHNMKTGISLRCAYCAGNFKSRNELEHHMKACHNSTGRHKCLICDEIFPSPTMLAEHKLQHSKVGQSLKCSHCGKPLADVSTFKVHLRDHNNEGQLPMHCICCRQSLHSDFEISLHAQFHTKPSCNPESSCALCLEPIPSYVNGEAKVCEHCCQKHKLVSKFNPQYRQYNNCDANATLNSECRCNICKLLMPNTYKLQEHLVEHTFSGYDQRGFNCYICSAIFTTASGLLPHMQEHGLQCRPYDCNLCTEKFFFSAELEHHLLGHELENPNALRNLETDSCKFLLLSESDNRNVILPAVKKETLASDTKPSTCEEDEYIEIESVSDPNQVYSQMSKIYAHQKKE